MKKVFLGSFAVIFSLIWSFSALSAEVLVIMWQGQTSAERAFEKRLKELRPDVRFSYIDAKRKKTNLENALQKVDLDKIDLVYSFGTTGTKLVKKFLKGRKPMVFNLVSAPVLSNIADSIKKPGNNLTGARFLIYPETQLEILARIKQFRSLAIWFDPREKQHDVVLQKLDSVLSKRGVKVYPFRIIPDAEDFDKQLREAARKTNKLDAVYFIAGSSFYLNLKKLYSSLKPSLMAMSSLSAYVEAGSTLAVGADLTERGQTVAEQASKILNGAKAGEIPISLVTSDKAYLYINKNKMATAGLTNIDKLGMKIKLIEPTQ